MARIKVTNDDGFVLIDETYVNLCLRYKQVGIVSGEVDYYTNTVRMPISFSGALYAPMLVICSSMWSCVLSYSGGTWWIVWEAGSSGRSFEYMIFDVPDVALPGTGLVVLRNAQNQVTFDSDGQYMRCNDMLTLSEQLSSKTYPAGRKYGIAHVSGLWTRQFIPLPAMAITQILHYYCGFRVSGSIVYSGKFAEFNRALTGDFARSATGSSPGMALIIDVTGY